MRNFFRMVLCLSAIVMLTGCGPKHYIISQHLLSPIPVNNRVSVADVKDDLPSGLTEEKRPTREQVEKFRNWIAEALHNRGMFTDTTSASPINYEVRSTLREFEKGSGVGRFLLGRGLGFDGEISIRMQLVNKSSNEVLFAGDFKARAQGWAETSGTSFQKIAIDFANALKKDIGKLTTGK